MCWGTIMFCSKCGTRLAAEAKYCSSCGERKVASAVESREELAPKASLYQVKSYTNTETQADQLQVVRPWVRYWARMFDVALFGLVFGFILAMLYPLAFIEPHSEEILTLLILFFWVFIEAGLLSVFGTTPGKKLFKITLIKEGKHGFNFSDGVSRSLKVWWRGLGIGVPLITMITMIVAYSKLKNNQRTTWDADEGVIVQHGKIGFFRVVFALALFFAFFFLMFIGSEM